ALVDLASNVTGILPVGNGGTGWASLAAGAIPYGNGGSALATTSVGLPGQVLALLNGVPTWTATSSLSTISGTLGVASGGTNATSLGSHMLVAFNGTSIVATSTPSAAAYLATSTTATSTFAGGFSAASSLYALQNGNVGIGTARPGATLDI